MDMGLGQNWAAHKCIVLKTEEGLARFSSKGQPFLPMWHLLVRSFQHIGGPDLSGSSYGCFSASCG